MSKVAVVYWSGTGNTAQMADAVVEGAKGAGAEAELIECNSFTADQVANYDAIAFGCPAMGAEVLEESEFDPMFTSVEGLAAPSAMCQNTPDDEALEACKTLGAALA